MPHNALRTLAPTVAADVEEFWDRPLAEYARHLHRLNLPPSDRYQTAFRTTLDAIVGQEVNTIDTANHLHFLADPLVWEPTFIALLGNQSGHRKSFNVLGAGITMESYNHTGPGWITFDAEPMLLFDLPRRALYKMSLCANITTSLSSGAVTEFAKTFAIDVDMGASGVGDKLLILNKQALERFRNATDRHYAFDEGLALSLISWDIANDGPATSVLTSPGFLDRWTTSLSLLCKKFPLAALFGPKSIMPFRILHKNRLYDRSKRAAICFP